MATAVGVAGADDDRSRCRPRSSRWPGWSGSARSARRARRVASSVMATTTFLTVSPGAKVSVPLVGGVVAAGGRRAVAGRVVDGHGAGRDLARRGRPGARRCSRCRPSRRRPRRARTARAWRPGCRCRRCRCAPRPGRWSRRLAVLQAERERLEGRHGGRQSTMSTRTTLVVSPGAKLRVPLTPSVVECCSRSRRWRCCWRWRS